MATYRKVVIGALAGIGVYAAGRAMAPAKPPIRNREPVEGLPRARIDPPRPGPPALSPAKVKKMVLEWGMDPKRFHGKARLWAVTAAKLALEGQAKAQLALPAPPTEEVWTQGELDEAAARAEHAFQLLGPDDKLELDALLERYLLSDATNGHFYEIQPGDTPETIAKAVLTPLMPPGQPVPKQSINEYIWCFSGCTYNLVRYGSGSTSNSYPEKWLVPGMGQGLRGAFLPRNADALDLMASGKAVPRTIDDDAVSLEEDATSRGTIWLAKVCPVALAQDGTVTCYPFPWPDGSTSLEPPPAWGRLTTGDS